MICDSIYVLSPKVTPLAKPYRGARVLLRTRKGGSMRRQKLRTAKPIKFTVGDARVKIYEWTRDVLSHTATAE